MSVLAGDHRRPRRGQTVRAQAWRQALSDADHLAVLHAMWDRRDHARRASSGTGPCSGAALPAGSRAAAASHKEQWLHRTLRAAELAGLDAGRGPGPRGRQRSLVGARDIPAVIDARIRHRYGDLIPRPAAAWSAQVPETA